MFKLVNSVKSSVTSQQRRTLTNIDKSNKKVCVVGGGVSGLQTVNSLKNLGIEFTLFESQSDLGGVWLERDSYNYFETFDEQFESRWLSKEGENMQLSEYEALSFIRKFASETGIYKSCKLQTKVESIMPISMGWYVQYRDVRKDLIYNEKFDYVVVCSGIESSHNSESDAACNANLVPN